MAQRQRNSPQQKKRSGKSNNEYLKRQVNIQFSRWRQSKVIMEQGGVRGKKEIQQ